jgi:N-acetylglucosaminyl-diphospho-decaprenol L-rhamnosyltransferase
VKTAAVVVNHNTREQLLQCLAALRDETAQTIVVDTGSADGSADRVRREFSAVELIETENRGYGAGANAGLRSVRFPTVLLLNADTRPARGASAALAAYLDRHPRVAVAGPRIVDERGRPQPTARRFPTPGEILLQESGLHRLRPSGHRVGEARRVDWVLGAALALRRDAVSEVGCFDETYFMYNEEIDLCLRLQRAGWETHYAPVTTVGHVGGASTPKRRAATADQYVRSTLALYRRHFSPRQESQVTAVLAAALAARRGRERIRLLLTADPTRRAALQSDLEAWRAAGIALRGLRSARNA